MARMKHPQIVTANDLFEGDVVYLTQNGDWARSLRDAFVLQEPEQAALWLAKADAQQGKIVGPYLADVEIGEDGCPEPVHFREAFRMRGPSNYFHGKQAEA